MKKIHSETRKCEQEIIDALVCDICKKEYPDGWDESRGDPYSFETQVSLVRKFDSWDDHNIEQQWSFDICPDCMENKIKPFVESFRNGDPK